MANAVKKYIDAFVRLEVKKHGNLTAANLPVKKNEGKEVFDAESWLLNLFSLDVHDVLPNTRQQFILFEVMAIPVGFKQSLRVLCENRHPLLVKEFQDAGVREICLTELIQLASKFELAYLDYFSLFYEDLDQEYFSRETVNARIDKIAKDSSAGTVISHSAKMTNPQCKYPRVFATSNKSDDGYIRTGNAPVNFDMHINATLLKVFKFVSLSVGGERVKDVISRNDVSLLASIFGVKEERARLWVDSFYDCLSLQDLRAHNLVKQVYFPVDKDYHLLSPLVPSGLVFALKEKIDLVNSVGVEGYLGRKHKKGEQHFDSEYMSIPNLTEMRHGGDHPKNISGLNNKYQSFYLLSAMPPTLKKRDLHFPTTDFFSQSLDLYLYRNFFQKLHRLYLTPTNNLKVRNARDSYFGDLSKKDPKGQASSIIGRLIETLWAVRAISAEQYNPETSLLPKYQKVWLCDGYEHERLDDIWLADIESDIVRWLHAAYEKVIGKKAIKFGDDEYQYLIEQVHINREALR